MADMRFLLIGFAAWGGLISATVVAEEAVDFQKEIRPIISNHCFACHGPDQQTREADVRLDVADEVDLEEMLARITSTYPDLMMPPPEMNKPLNGKQISTLTRWIEQGAPHEQHWAFSPTQDHGIPQPKLAPWSDQPIDRFVLANLVAKKLLPSPRADKRTLIRRVTLDLTGLPPTLEQIDAITDWAHAQGALVIAIVNPTSLALLKPPGEWGADGADIACGEGQPLGIPLSSGGPYFGFLACRQKIVRQMPGRIVGRTTDLEGKTGYTLTLQAREQHIRRSKATSNICTNQGLMVTAATIYMSLLGHQGLARVARTSHANTKSLAQALTAIDGVELLFAGPCFHEAAIRLNAPVAKVLVDLAKRNVLGGFDLSADYPELGNALLVCATETKTGADIAAFASALADVLASQEKQSA